MWNDVVVSSAAAPLYVSAAQRDVLETWARSQAIPHRQVQRARIVLLAADGIANEVIAAQLNTSKPSVLKWRARFAEAGVDGLDDAAGRGRRPIYGRKFVEKVVSTTLRKPPRGVTHWSTRSLAAQLGVSHGTINTIWRDMGLQPHRTRTFKHSNDPLLEEKVTTSSASTCIPPRTRSCCVSMRRPRSRHWIALSHCCR